MFPKVGTPLAIGVVAGLLILLLFVGLFLWMRRAPGPQHDVPAEQSRMLAPALSPTASSAIPGETYTRNSQP